jgi:NAD-dependent SIR2 family protein deacetylase
MFSWDLAYDSLRSMSDTLLIPLLASFTPSSICRFAIPSGDPSEQLVQVLDVLEKASRVVVICGECSRKTWSCWGIALICPLGAGISTAAGISDFRSQGGLFESIKAEYPRVFRDGKDIFSASALKQEKTREPFCKMIGGLARLSQSASPTPFHELLRRLEASGQLLRVYTQNIDCLEAKCVSSFGVPEDRHLSSRKRSPRSTNGTLIIPRCIALHGRIDKCHCPLCFQSYPTNRFIDTFDIGIFPSCPGTCAETEMLRPFTNKRSRGIGELRPSIVLYDEVHPHDDAIGQAVDHDLEVFRKHSRIGGGVVVLVVGTSLAVPGVKQIARAFSSAAHRSPNIPNLDSKGDHTCGFRSIYLNLELPSPSTAWKGVFDAWIYGDLQDFAEMMNDRVKIGEA